MTDFLLCNNRHRSGAHRIELNRLDKLFYLFERLGITSLSRIHFALSGGTIERERMQRAYDRVCVRYPVLRARLRERRGLLRWRAWWQPAAMPRNGDGVRWRDFSRCSMPEAETCFQRELLDPYAGYDVRRDPPFWLVVCRMPDGWRIIMFVHHAVTDAHGYALIARDLFLAYNSPATAVPAQPGAVAPGPPGRPGGLLRACRELAGCLKEHRRHPPTKLLEGTCRSGGRVCAEQRTLTAGRLERCREAARAQGVTFNDLLTAAQLLSICLFQHRRSRACDGISVQVHQNLRTAAEGSALPGNLFSTFPLLVCGHACADPAALLQRVAAGGRAARQHKRAAALAGAAALLDLGPVRRLYRWWGPALFANPQAGDSTQVTNVGRLWAGTDGRPAITRVGDSRIESCHMIGPPVPSIGSYISFCTYGDRMFLSLNYYDWALTAGQARQLMDGYLQALDSLSHPGVCSRDKASRLAAAS